LPFRFRFPPTHRFGRAGKARRAEGRFGLCPSARRAR
jgi:hypothetical protein